MDFNLFKVVIDWVICLLQTFLATVSKLVIIVYVETISGYRFIYITKS